jgi:hypothetical protein
MLRFLRNSLASLLGRRQVPALRLAEERKSEFFSWFNLEERAPPTPAGAGCMRHAFHPSGPAFQEFVRLDLEVTRGDLISIAQLALDRSFVEEPRTSAFARDIAKSFLIWALRHEPGDGARALIDNIARRDSVGAPVIARTVPPIPPPDRTGAYDVYLGQRDAAELVLVQHRVHLRNRANGRRWLIVEVRALSA